LYGLHSAIYAGIPSVLSKQFEGRRARKTFPRKRFVAGQSVPATSLAATVAHGQMLATPPFRMYKHWVHEGGIASPLLISYPRFIKESCIETELAHIMDIMPTCLDLA